MKVKIKNLWLCNPPTKIYEDVLKNYDKKIITEHRTQYPAVTIDNMRDLAEGFNEAVIGQPHVMKQALASIYALQNNDRK